MRLLIRLKTINYVFGTVSFIRFTGNSIIRDLTLLERQTRRVKKISVKSTCSIINRMDLKRSDGVKIPVLLSSTLLSKLAVYFTRRLRLFT